jgi:hypothetical protein
LIPFLTCLFFGTEFCVVHSSWGQIPFPVLNVSAREYDGTNLCDNVPDRCGGVSWISELGTYEFDVYPSMWSTGSDSIRFGVSWPAEWELVEFALCDAVFDFGEPWAPGSGAWLHYTECRDDHRPIMRIVLNCTVPGRFSVGGESHDCFYDEWMGFFYDHHVDIGEFCGMNPQPVCGFCQYTLAGNFSPYSLNVVLPPGGIYTRTIRVHGDWVSCPALPECWPPPNPPCSSFLYDTASWISLELVQAEDFNRWYEVTVDADDLDPGVYQERIYITGNCEACRETCMPVQLTVLHPSSADEPDETQPAFRLDPGQPSLFRDRSTLAFRLPREGRVTLQIYDIRGALVATLVDRHLHAGSHVTTWMGQSDSGTDLPSGIYFGRLRLGDLVSSQRLILIR